MSNATKKLLAKLLVLCMIAGMIPAAALSTTASAQNSAYYAVGVDTTVLEANETVFTDVPDYAYYTAAVNWAAANGVTDGVTATSFGPEQNCTMEQIMTFLWKAAGRPAVFNNASAGATDYVSATQWAREAGIIQEGEGFTGGAVCTRQDMVLALWRAAGAPHRQGDLPFTDLPEGIDDDLKTAIIWAVQQGITNGNGSPTTFDPNGGCTRAQMITFLYRAYA